MSITLPSSRAAGRASPAQGHHAPVMVIVMLVLVTLVPIEISFNIGPMFFTTAKLFLMIVAIPTIIKAFQIKFEIYDWLFLGHTIWSCFAFLLAYGTPAIGGASGNYFLEFFIVYLFARVYLTQLGQFRATISAMFVMLVISGAFALPEAILQVRFIHDFASALTGFTYRWSNETRMGIMRAASFFEHPILYGIFCSSLFTLVWFTSSTLGRIWKAPLIAGATFLSASSAPLMILIIQFWLIGIERVTRKIKRRVLIIGGSAAALAIFLNTASNSGVVGLIARLTLNPNTAYTRRSQWIFGIDDVMRNPIFGFDPSLWTRPHWLAPSIDNYWLLMMMRAGIPSIMMLALSAFFIWRKLASRGVDVPEDFRKMRIAWGLTMVALILGGATVAYFGKLQPLFSFYMGFGAALAVCALPKTDSTEPEPVAKGPAYTRFSRKPQTTDAAQGAPTYARTTPMQRGFAGDRQ